MEEFKNLQETKLTSQPIFDGDVLHIYKDTVRLPNGKTSTREYTCLLYTSPSPRDS